MASDGRWRCGAISSGILVLLPLLSNGCATPMKPKDFADTTPAFDPIQFWTGHTASWGVIENRDGAPTSIITTSTAGTAERSQADDIEGLHMVQHVMTGGKDSIRDWHIRRLADGKFEATASDLVGVARGAPSGRTLHWVWVLAARPGNHLLDLRMEQWMYLADNGTLLVRTIVTKLGVRLAEISEQFVQSGATSRPSTAAAAVGLSGN